MNHSFNSLVTRFLFGPNASRTGAAAWALIVACVALLVWKVFAIRTLNVNWDEFYFLTHVHALVRGDLDLPFQTTYTQVFRWLPWVGGGEMTQIHVARLCMFFLLALSTWQIVRLSARWTSPAAALAAAIGFLCLLSTQMHGASFRADSLLLPLLLGAVLLLTRPLASRPTDVAVGVLCGLGLAVSIKMTLFAPLFLACVLLSGDVTQPMATRVRSVMLRCAVIGAVAVVVAVALVGLHQLSLRGEDLESASTFADRSLAKTILETSFLPNDFALFRLLRADRFPWIVMALGLVLAMVRRRWQLAVMALSVSPVLYYRNAFPYFYVDMLAPAAVLMAVVVDEVRVLASRGSSPSRSEWVPAALGLLLVFHGASRWPTVGADQQIGQRAVLEAVHQIFPSPVPYMDHAGMVSTYHKVNFFMSTWGKEEYQRRGVPFVRPALRRFRPPLLLVNRSYLNVYSQDSQSLLPEDRDALYRFYQPYWGPILVAGINAVLTDLEPQIVMLPFPGRYRVDSPEPVLVDGVARVAGEIVEISGETVRLARQQASTRDSLDVRLLTAEAGPAPAAAPDFPPIFTGL